MALLVAEQGLFKGNHSIDPSQARTYVDEYFAEVTAAAGKAHEIVAKVGQRDAAVIDSLSDLPIGTLLAVLDDVRAAGKIDDLIDLVSPIPPSSRVMAALLTAGGHLGLRWRKAVDDMVPAEQAIVRSFLVDRVVYADTFAPTPISGPAVARDDAPGTAVAGTADVGVAAEHRLERSIRHHQQSRHRRLPARQRPHLRADVTRRAD